MACIEVEGRKTRGRVIASQSALTRESALPPLPETAIEALNYLKELATATTPYEALDASNALRKTLGELAFHWNPIIDSLAERAGEVFRLKRMAGCDELTGIANRRAFRDALERECARSERTGAGLSIILVDLDGLKTINDHFGHAAGDDAIVATAHSCLDALRATDLVARLGGDEFALLLPETDAGEAAVVAERIRRHIEDQVLESGRLKASVGVASSGAEPTDAASLTASADRALYADKRSRQPRTEGATEAA
ncbi:MAG: GGDEF domain-containing protein [Myxococcota bacterium]